MKPRSDGLRNVTFHGRIGTLGRNSFAYNAMLETVIGLENVENFEEDPFVGTPFETKAAE